MFRIVAGKELYDSIQASKEAQVPKRNGYYESEALCQFQRNLSRRGILEIEIVKSNYGYSVRYASGLQNWGLVRKAQELGGTLEAAEEFCREWVAQSPSNRYASIQERD